MKNIFKKIGYILIASFIVISSVYITSTIKVFGREDEGGNPVGISPLIHRGGGHQYITGVFNIVEPINNIQFNTTSPDANAAVFEKPTDSNDSFFSVLDNSWIGGRMFVGVPRSSFMSGGHFGDDLQEWSSLSDFNHNFGNLNNPIYINSVFQKVNVGGDNANVRATNLVNASGTDSVCIDENGTLILCVE